MHTLEAVQWSRWRPSGTGPWRVEETVERGEHWKMEDSGLGQRMQGFEGEDGAVLLLSSVLDPQFV